MGQCPSGLLFLLGVLLPAYNVQYYGLAPPDERGCVLVDTIHLAQRYVLYGQGSMEVTVFGNLGNLVECFLEVFDAVFREGSAFDI